MPTHKLTTSVVKADYFHEEVLCRNTGIGKEPASVASFLKRVMLTLKDTTSIIALDENNNEAIAGFLLLKRVHQDDYGRIFSRMQIVNGEAHTKFANFTDYLNRKCNIFYDFQCNVFLRFYLLCMTRQYRKKGIIFGVCLTILYKKIYRIRDAFDVFCIGRSPFFANSRCNGSLLRSFPPKGCKKAWS